MAIALAEPEVVSLNRPTPEGPELDTLSTLGGITAPAAHLNGNARVGGDEGYAWLEPPPGAVPSHEGRVELMVVGDWGGSTLPAAAQFFDTNNGRVLRATYYTLTVAIGDSDSETVIRWWMEPGGDDATLRTDALDFLKSIHRPGLIVARDAGSLREIVRAPLRAEAGFDSELQAAHQFLQQVAVLEEWSGTRIPVPEEVSTESATEIARAVALVHARQVPLVLGEGLTVTVESDPGPDGFDELRLPRTFSADILGVEVPLGEGLISVAVEPVDVEPAEGGLFRVRCRLADDQSRRTSVHLYPPPTRSRLLRRTLVAGTSVPPRPDLVGLRVDTRLRAEAERYLSERETERGRLPHDLLAEIESEWPE